MRFVLFLLSRLPLRLHYFNATWLAFLMHRVIRYRLKVVRENLKGSFPEKSEDELRTIERRFYRHLAFVAVEAIWFGGCKNPERLKKSHIVELLHPESIQKLYDDAPSVMVLYSHSGNWEIMGGIQEYNYTDSPSPFNEGNTCYVYRRQSSAMWDKILSDNRIAPLHDRSSFEGYVESRNLVRFVLSRKGRKMLINVNTDQRPYFSAPDFIYVEFMHRNVRTMSAAAALAHKLGMAVAYQRMLHKPGYGYTIEYLPICPDASRMEVADIMQRYYRLLEEDLREQPQNYLWTHKRWAA